MDYDLQKESCKLSLQHMTKLAIKERDYNHYNFVTTITTPVSYTCPDTVKELDVLRGVTMTNKNCYYKRPEYNKGKWENQFQKDLPYEKDVMFNVQTKRITKS